MEGIVKIWSTGKIEVIKVSQLWDWFLNKTEISHFKDTNFLHMPEFFHQDSAIVHLEIHQNVEKSQCPFIQICTSV